ncbi:MAG: GNAT family N-acetyltransferase [Thermoleophilia bacterium]|nr:GNAT family N-acetyltransferase [Thermoleophilia bacterium]
MAFVELEDRNTIAAFLRRNAHAHVYELGDLDDFDWPHTRWFGWTRDGRLEQIALLYTAPAVPVVIAIAEKPLGAMADLLRAARDLLPPVLHAHVTAPLLDTLAERWRIEAARPHLKLALMRSDLLAGYAVPVEILGPADLDEIETFYAAAYPGTWFVPRMLETGRYVGIRQNGQLVCVVGVHVYSPTWRVAALGNIATLPELRGQGLARGTCAALCLLLLADGAETIALNVQADNAAALQAYARLGFEAAAVYTEATLVAR